MSSQDGTADPSPLPGDIPPEYPGDRVPRRDTEPIAALPDPGVDEMVRRRHPGVQAPTGHGMEGGQPLSDQPEGVPMSDNSDRLEAFYRDLLHELGEFARRPSATAIGAAVVVKRVALAYDVDAAQRLPLPRFSRAEREERSETSWRADQ